MKTFVAALVIALVTVFGLAETGHLLRPRPSVPSYLQSVTATMSVGDGLGTGTIFKSKSGEFYVLTAHHVIDSLYNKETKTFKNIKVIQFLYENDKNIGMLGLEAEVIRASTTLDIAVLRILSNKYLHTSSKFYFDKPEPEVGTPIYHVGTFKGISGHNSLTTGVVSQHDRAQVGHKFTQISASHFPGSSGGGVFLEDGRYVGMVIATISPTYGFATPINAIREWLHKSKLDFVVDNSITPPALSRTKSEGLFVE
jgi:S1-C subfamily serine protease